MRIRFLQIGKATLVALALAVPQPGLPQQAATPFAGGEKLTYSVTWSIFPAGTVTASLRTVGEDSKDAFEVTTTAHSQGVVSLLYNVENEFHSIFDPQTACSQRISKKINEGRRRKDTTIVFDSARKLAILDERDLNRPNDPPKHAENQIPGCVEDVVAAFYFLRLQDFAVGKSIHLPVNDGSKTTDVTVEVQARERIQTPLGNRESFRVEPKVFSGLFKRKGRMLIWFSDDPQRLPLRIKAIISVGTLTGNLVSVTQAPVNPPEKH